MLTLIFCWVLGLPAGTAHNINRCPKSLSSAEPTATLLTDSGVRRPAVCEIHMVLLAYWCTPITHLSFWLQKKKKGFSFFVLWGDPVQNRPQNPAPAGCLLSTRKSRSEIPERGDFGEENCLGKRGVDRAKKEKRIRKKRRDCVRCRSPRPSAKCWLCFLSHLFSLLSASLGT